MKRRDRLRSRRRAKDANGPRADSADWHRCACTWNWDQPFDVLNWIVRKPDLRRRHRHHPLRARRARYYGQFASVAEIEAKASSMMETVRFLIEICERWQAGRYSARRFRPDQLPDVDPKDVPWPVPTSLARAKAQGVALNFTEWNEGFPPMRLRTRQ